MNPPLLQTGTVASPPRIRRGFPVWLGGLLLGILVAGGATLVYFNDPVLSSFYPVCAFHKLTGLNCPGCGATRAVFALLHGRWQAAWRDNALFLVTMGALLARAGWLALNRARRRPVASLIPTRCLIPWLVVALIFGVVRNLPLGAFLSP